MLKEFKNFFVKLFYKTKETSLEAPPIIEEVVPRLTDFQLFCEQVLICVTTFDRKEVTEICLKNLSATKNEATLWIFDDHSKDYDLDFLKTLCPSARIFRFSNKLGVERLRMEIQKEASKTNYRYIYHTDNDAYHDSVWLNRLYEISQKHKGLIGLYNTFHHFHQTIEDKDDFILRKSCPGISFFFEQSLLKEMPPHLYNSWDFVVGDLLLPAAISKVSYVEHIGLNGIHNKEIDRDRAFNPTEWLKEERVLILKTLNQHGLL